MTFDLQRAVTGLVASTLLKIHKEKKKDFPFVCEFSVCLFTFFFLTSCTWHPGSESSNWRVHMKCFYSDQPFILIICVQVNKANVFIREKWCLYQQDSLWTHPAHLTPAWLQKPTLNRVPELPMMQPIHWRFHQRFRAANVALSSD